MPWPSVTDCQALRERRRIKLVYQKGCSIHECPLYHGSEGGTARLSGENEWVSQKKTAGVQFHVVSARCLLPRDDGKRSERASTETGPESRYFSASRLPTQFPGSKRTLGAVQRISPII